jgi:hypothetical protein
MTVLAATRDVDRWARRFLRFFPKGFADPKYFDWERGYKIRAHEQFEEQLGREAFALLLKQKQYQEIAATAVRIESRTNLLFSFEKMALRDAVKEKPGAKVFSEGLFELLYGPGDLEKRFTDWCDAIASLPRKQTRVLTHPIATVFPSIADPKTHIFLKPTVTKTAAARLGYEFEYNPRPAWRVYNGLLKFAENLRRDLRTLRPKDLIDIQSFIWVSGSAEYE